MLYYTYNNQTYKVCVFNKLIISHHVKTIKYTSIKKYKSKILQRQLNFIQVALWVSLISEHEDVQPVNVQLWKPLRCSSSVPEYVNLPLLADNSNYVQD